MIIKNRFIGSFSLDVTVSEQHQSKLKITDNPIESGAVISDHAVLEPISISITGIVVNYEPMKPDVISEMASRFLGDIGGQFVSKTLATIQTERARLSSYILPVVHQLDAASKKLQSVASWLTGRSDNETSTETDRLSELYDGLLALQKSGETIEVQTGIKLYQNMLIESISATTTNDNALELSLEIREVHIVETKKISGVPSPANNSRAKSQSSKKSQAGKTQATDDVKKDVSKSIALEMKGGTGYKRTQ